MNDQPEGEPGIGPLPGADEPARRLRRSLAYLDLWAVGIDTSSMPPLAAEHVELRDADEVTGRTLALCGVGLKGQGLELRESWAYCDAYGVWDHMLPDEHDLILDPAPTREALIQAAWRFEGVWVLLWALGLVRHLGFPDHACDSGEAVRLVIQAVATVPADQRPLLRPVAEILDSADVARRLAAICDAARRAASGYPSGIDPGVVHERAVAFEWLVH